MKTIKYLLIGVLFAVVADNLTSCKKESSNPVDPDPTNPPETEVIADLEDDAVKVQTAFQSGSVTEVKKVISETASSIYGNDLESVKGKFSGFAEALKTKKLIAFSELYAEYEISENGKTYFVAFAKQNETGEWKLVRF